MAVKTEMDKVAATGTPASSNSIWTLTNQRHRIKMRLLTCLTLGALAQDSRRSLTLVELERHRLHRSSSRLLVEHQTLSFSSVGHLELLSKRQPSPCSSLTQVQHNQPILWTFFRQMALNWAKHQSQLHIRPISTIYSIRISHYSLQWQAVIRYQRSRIST